MDEKDNREILTVIHGQDREIKKAKSTIEQLQNDDELESLQKESLSLLGETEIIPEKIEPVRVNMPETATWEDLVKRHEDALIKDGSSGFSVLLAGRKDTKKLHWYDFNEIGSYWQRRAKASAPNAISIRFRKNSKIINLSISDKDYGFSCRCIQD